MNIDSIKRGIVLDHIQAGRSMDIYRYLHLDELECSVAIIKIDEAIDIDLNVLGYIDPGITVNIIDEGRIVEKKHLNLPLRLVNVVRCKNPRCITSAEPSLDHIFKLADEKRRVYRCIYCDAERTKNK